MKFSVVIPTRDRYGRLKRALDSLSVQTFGDFETIVVDDGSIDKRHVELIYDEWVFEGVDLIRFDKSQGRVVARNAGMKAATGEWICWLDSDDAYDQEYLNAFAYHIDQEPEANLWVCGSIYHGMWKDENGKHICPRWTKFRRPWKPPLNPDPPPVHAHFTSGKVGTGMFAFRRSIWEPMPDWSNHNQVADGIDDYLGYETGYGTTKRLVGNPWGDDFAQFRKLTMAHEVHLIDAHLYVQYMR